MTQKSPVVETALTVAKGVSVGVVATIAGISGVGPILAALLTEFIPNQRVERLDAFVTELAYRVERLEDKLDLPFVQSEEFALGFEDIMERSVRAQNAEKIAAFAEFAARSMTVDRPEKMWRERYLDLLSELRPAHLLLLAALATSSVGPAQFEPKAFSLGEAFYAKLAEATATLDQAQVMYDLDDLARHGLTSDVASSANWLMATQDVRRLLTPLGHAFVAFMSAEALSSLEAKRPKPGRCRGDG